MNRYIVRRLVQMVLTFFGATFILYALMFGWVNDPLQALYGDRPVPEAQRIVLTEQHHLNEPFLVQYGYYMKGLLTGDFGSSITGKSVSGMLERAFPVTVELTLLSILFVIVVGITTGVIAGMRRGGFFDTGTLVLALFFIAIPIIVIAPLAQFLLGVQWRIVPVTAGIDPGLLALLLPALVNGSSELAVIMRLSRTSIAENLRSDYARTATAKGLWRGRVVGVHVLRNSMIPVVTTIGIGVGDLMAGTVITEGVFNIPGVGFNLLRGVRTEDAPVVVGFASVIVIVYMITSLVADLLYAVLDPRIRYE